MVLFTHISILNSRHGGPRKVLVNVFLNQVFNFIQLAKNEKNILSQIRKTSNKSFVQQPFLKSENCFSIRLLLLDGAEGEGGRARSVSAYR